MDASYGEKSEFKNVCDGFGDHTKTPLKRAVESRDLVLSKPEDIFLYLRDTYSFGPESEHTIYRRTYYFVAEKEIDRNRPERCGKEIPGLLRIHSVLGLEIGFVAVRLISCYCINCIKKDWNECLN